MLRSQGKFSMASSKCHAAPFALLANAQNEVPSVKWQAPKYQFRAMLKRPVEVVQQAKLAFMGDRGQDVEFALRP